MKLIMAALASFFICFHTVNAQIINPKETAKRKVDDRANRKTDETIDRGLDKIEEGIGNIFKKKEKKSKGESQAPVEPPVKSTSGSSGTVSDDYTDFSEYEGSAFVPGKDLLFFENFETSRLGSGSQNWEVIEFDAADEVEKPGIKTIAASSGNWLKTPRKGVMFPNGFKALPEQFTLEYDMYIDPERMSEMEGGFRTTFIAKNDREEYSMHWSPESSVSLDVHPYGHEKMLNIQVTKEYNSNLTMEELVLFSNTFKSAWNSGKVNRVSISRNSKHIMLYINGKEMVNLPNGLPQKAQYNLVFSTNMWGDGIYVSNIRIAGNIVNAKEEVKKEGKFVTNAIYFDVNSARIKPESWATLKQTSEAIKANPGNFLIVGHTDSDGADDANLKLSQNRATSVKNALVNDFGIEASRLTTDGKGEAQPLEPNTTASGKAKNRRVEFVKL